MSIKIELTDEQIEDVVLADLVTQLKFCQEPDLKPALRKVIDYYLESVDQNSNDPVQESYMYGDPDDIKISINGERLFFC